MIVYVGNIRGYCGYLQFWEHNLMCGNFQIIYQRDYDSKRSSVIIRLTLIRRGRPSILTRLSRCLLNSVVVIALQELLPPWSTKVLAMNLHRWDLISTNWMPFMWIGFLFIRHSGKTGWSYYSFEVRFFFLGEVRFRIYLAVSWNREIVIYGYVTDTIRLKAEYINVCQSIILYSDKALG